MPKPAVRTPPVKDQRGLTLLAAVAIVILAAAPYVQTRHFGLVWDDRDLLTQVARAGHQGGVLGLFRTDFRVGADRPLGYYRPVATVSMWQQMASGSNSAGTDALAKSAGSLHVVNVWLHIACSVLVWLILRRMAVGSLPAFLGAALFATHPVHVESVAFISGRTDLLAALFVLASTLCWLNTRGVRGARRALALVGASLLLLAGALSKEQALLLPAVLVVWSFFLSHKKENWWRENSAWLAGYAAALAVALLLRNRAGVGFGPSDAERPFSFLFMGPRALLLYIKLWFSPWPLNNYYMPVDLAPDWVTAISVLATLGLIVLAIRQGRRGEAIASCVFAFVFLLPVLHIRPFNGAVAAARFFYLASAGLALLTTFALSGLQKMKTARVAGGAIVCAAIVAGLILSTNGTRSWANETTFYTHMVETSPRSAISHHGMAEVFMKAGRLPEAAEECRQAIQLDATFADGHELLGVIAAKQRDFETARTEFEAVKSLRPQKASAYKNLGLIAMQQSNAAEAIENFRQALALEPQAADIHYCLGTVLAATGDLDGAAREAQVLDSLDPAHAQALRKMLNSATPAPARP